QDDSLRQPRSVPEALGGRRVMRFDGVDDCMEAPNGGQFDGDVITILLVLANRTDDAQEGNACAFAIRGDHGGQTRISVHMNDGKMSMGTFNSIGSDATDFSFTEGAFFFLDLERASGNFDHFVN